ncbi:unnamed protein product [[Candida] boidinii]|nr:unnamed protein product [[Candida] boidinii]GMF59295.1 unnamed protein product [[Candida] boidinii]
MNPYPNESIMNGITNFINNDCVSCDKPVAVLCSIVDVINDVLSSTGDPAPKPDPDPDPDNTGDEDDP